MCTVLIQIISEYATRIQKDVSCGLHILATLWFAYIGNAMDCIYWQRYGLHILAKLWFTYVGNAMVYIYWQRYGLHILATLWFTYIGNAIIAYIGNAMVYIYWQRYSLHILATLWFTYIGNAMVYIYWQRYGLHILHKIIEGPKLSIMTLMNFVQNVFRKPILRSSLIFPDIFSAQLPSETTKRKW